MFGVIQDLLVEGRFRGNFEPGFVAYERVPLFMSEIARIQFFSAKMYYFGNSRGSIGTIVNFPGLRLAFPARVLLSIVSLVRGRR